MEAGGEYASNRSIASTAVDVVRPGATRFIAFFAWQSDKAGTDSGQLKISAKPDQSQQYAEINFQIDAYISGSRHPPALSSLPTPTETGGPDENGNDGNDGPSRGRGRLR